MTVDSNESSCVEGVSIILNIVIIIIRFYILSLIFFLLISQSKKKWDSSSRQLHSIYFMWCFGWFCFVYLLISINSWWSKFCYDLSSFFIWVFGITFIRYAQSQIIFKIFERKKTKGPKHYIHNLKSFVFKECINVLHFIYENVDRRFKKKKL